MKPQEKCLIGEPGAGAHYMDIFDSLHYSVRERLRESLDNFCLACLSMEAGQSYDPEAWHFAIDNFEKGVTYADRQRQIYSGFETSYLRGNKTISRDAIYSSDNVYDPFGEPSRSPYDFDRGSVYRGFQEWASESSRRVSTKDDRRREEEAIRTMMPPLELAKFFDEREQKWVPLYPPKKR